MDAPDPEVAHGHVLGYASLREGARDLAPEGIVAIEDVADACDQDAFVQCVTPIASSSSVGRK